MAQASNIISFPTPGTRPVFGAELMRRAEARIQREAASARPLSEIGRNERLRLDRGEAWKAAEAKLVYWQAWQDIHVAISDARRQGVIDNVNCPASLQKMHEVEDFWKFRIELLNYCDAAERDLMLTPAPTVEKLKWKRNRSKGYCLSDGTLDPEIARAIADDQAWLDAHPGRQRCKSSSRQID